MENYTDYGNNTTNYTRTNNTCNEIRQEEITVG